MLLIVLFVFVWLNAIMDFINTAKRFGLIDKVCFSDLEIALLCRVIRKDKFMALPIVCRDPGGIWCFCFLECLAPNVRF